MKNTEKATGLQTALLTDEEAAALLGTSVNTLANWRATRRYPLPFVKVGRLVRYRRTDIEAFITSNLVSGL
ncbi:helix-turn-helix domain-containing protein [Paraburkholderia tropica]|uniref:helix-turn-helix domain-containing protein n=1 Tax=Paraburkholderia tropica TaxID=92647 RepID=UPI002AB05C34|nr:helix-turn-helix domain-containing protein [Paraburkholderia tropica]